METIITAATILAMYFNSATIDGSKYCYNADLSNGQVTTLYVYAQKGEQLRNHLEYRYEYDDNGRLVYYVETFSEGGKDSIAFFYDKNGCLVGYSEYGFDADPTEGNDVTDFLVTCDAQCRVLTCASVWEDTTWYVYDNQGRLLKKTQSWQTDKAETFDYNRHGRLERVRIGDKHHIDTHYRYDANGDTTKVWSTNWEHHEGDIGDHEVGEHKYYSYTKYDDHGNWTHATVTVSYNKISQKHTLIRTFSYYE